jgi:hypothetical protein
MLSKALGMAHTYGWPKSLTLRNSGALSTASWWQTFLSHWQPVVAYRRQPRLLAEFDALLLNLRKQGLNLRTLFMPPISRVSAGPLAVLPARTTLKSGGCWMWTRCRRVMRAHLHDTLNLDELAAQFKLSLSLR